MRAHEGVMGMLDCESQGGHGVTSLCEMERQEPVRDDEGHA